MSIQIGTLLLAYSIAREFFPDRIGIQLCGILLFASAPLFIGLTHQFFVEAFQLFTILLFYCIASRSQRMARLDIFAYLLIAANLAMRFSELGDRQGDGTRHQRTLDSCLSQKNHTSTIIYVKRRNEGGCFTNFFMVNIEDYLLPHFRRPGRRLTSTYRRSTLMTIQYFKNLRDLNRFLKTTPVDLPIRRLDEIRTIAKKKKPSSFMVWINPSGHVIDLSMRV